MQDKSGREYAKLCEIKPGSTVQVDAGFDCIPAHAIREVKLDDGGLYIDCTCGHHYLTGQLEDTDSSLVGLYHAPVPELILKRA